MYSSPDSRDGSDTVTTVLESAKSLDEIFYALSKYMVWDYLNYFLLQSFIERFADDDIELKSMMKQYQKDLTGYILAMQIPTYLNAIHAYKDPIIKSENSTTDSEDEVILKLSPEQKHTLFKKLQVKVMAKITDHSFSYVTDLWKSLTDQFVLPQLAMVLHSIAEGCIVITWFIPANLVNYIKRMAQEHSSMFANQNILKVILEEQCIYPVETEHEPSLPQSEVTSLKRKVKETKTHIGSRSASPGIGRVENLPGPITREMEAAFHAIRIAIVVQTTVLLVVIIIIMVFMVLWIKYVAGKVKSKTRYEEEERIPLDPQGGLETESDTDKDGPSSPSMLRSVEVIKG